jgi:microcystin-dependent protein
MVEDNKIIINSTASGAPTENGILEVERGSSDNVSIRWNETTDVWQLTNDGTTFADVQASVTAGAGLSRTANTLNVVSANSSRINVGAGNIDLATVTQTNTTGSAGVSFVQTHSVDAYGRIDGTVTASIRDADTTVKGIALFSAGDFSVSSGEVTIKNSGVDNVQLANSSFTINGTSINLGETSTITANAATLTGTMLPVTVVGSSLTSVGTLTTGVWNGSPIGIAYGGTGEATAPLALTALLPTQTSNSGKYLKTSGTEASWGALTVSDISEITASAAELNILDGATLSTSELNYVDGVTSSIQTQIDAKLATATASSTYETITNVNLKADIASPTFTGVPSAPTANSTTNTTQVATTAFVQTVALPSGSLMMWPAAAAPTGWLLCNGSAVSRTAYAALFAIIGTTYGIGDGSTTFNLPNYTNRVPVGAAGLYALGVTGGSKDATVVSHTHTASTAINETPHSHNFTRYNLTNINTGGFGSDSVRAGSQTDTTSSQSTGITATTTVASAGSSGTDANMQPYLAINFIIKT